MYLEEKIKSFDGTLIFLRKDYVEKPKGCFVLEHGVSESSDRYRHIAKFFNELGYDVISFDNRGNGRSGYRNGDCKSFHDFLDDLHEIVNLAKEDHKNQKVFLLGHSLGGFIVNAYGAKYNDVSGIVSSGAVGIFLPQVQLFRIMPFKPLKNIRMKNKLSNALSHDPQVMIDYEKDPYVNKYNYINLFGECFIRGIRFIRKNIKNLTVPILYLHGEKDAIVPNKSSQYLFEHVGSLDKEIHIIPEFYHEIFNETEKEIAFNYVKEWVLKHE